MGLAAVAVVNGRLRFVPAELLDAVADGFVRFAAVRVRFLDGGGMRSIAGELLSRSSLVRSI